MLDTIIKVIVFIMISPVAGVRSVSPPPPHEQYVTVRLFNIVYM